MQKLTVHDLLTLEAYASQRDLIRRDMIAYKKTRRLSIGPNATLIFENRKTMQYQIQEMLRIERLFEPNEIQHELDTYNALIPDGSNWKATFMLEYANREERETALRRLTNIQNRVWVQIANEKVFAVADEDIARENKEKTSAVHFLRFELPAPLVHQLRQESTLSFGIDHESYRYSATNLDSELRRSLLADLDDEKTS